MCDELLFGFDLNSNTNRATVRKVSASPWKIIHVTSASLQSRERAPGSDRLLRHGDIKTNSWKGSIKLI